MHKRQYNIKICIETTSQGFTTKMAEKHLMHHRDLLRMIDGYDPDKAVMRETMSVYKWNKFKFYAFSCRQRQHEATDQFIVCAPNNSDVYLTQVMDPNDLDFADDIEQYEIKLWFPSYNKAVTVSSIGQILGMLFQKDWI